ncbi:MAG: hypothetical protein L0220_05920 [Acidobacteria bacterium]|nr:hypothetical protein [Acidobacteriota bacterium]
MVIHEALRCNDGNLTKAAEDLGISRQWLGQLLKARGCNRNKRRGGKDPFHRVIVVIPEFSAKHQRNGAFDW